MASLEEAGPQSRRTGSVTSQSVASSNESEAKLPSSSAITQTEPRTKFREGDWTCTVCGANVFGRNISCFRCLSPKPGTNARHGDWVCLNKQCGAHNFAGRQTCYRCHVIKGAEKPGDWPCPNCHSNNFASRLECFRCRIPRPHGYGTVAYVNVRPGDWLCPNPACGSNVFANRESCFRCNTPRPVDAEVASTFSNMRTGDWACPNCKALCYANRLTCFQCDTPKPTVDPNGNVSMNGALPQQLTVDPNGNVSMNGALPQQQAVVGGFQGHPGLFPYGYALGYNPYMLSYYSQQMYQYVPRDVIYGQVPTPYRPREGDWTCPNCSELNFAKRQSCFKCKQPRSGEGARTNSDDASGDGAASKEDASVSTGQASPEVHAQ